MSKDARFVLICLLICAVSLFIGASWFYRAFPEASIDFKVDRLSSRPIAEKFLLSQEIDTGGYLHASSFQYDNQSKVFLERELGLKKANELMKSEVKLWRWGHRWFKPKQKEEIRAEITTSGQLASFSHILPENAPGGELSPDAARSLAESFLVLEMSIPVDSLEYVDIQSEKLANRTDHVLTWEIAGIDLKQGSYRVTVTVQGDRIGGYREFVKIPEEWSRGYARLRSLNETASQFDLTLVALLAVGMIVVFFRQVQRRTVPWTTALVFGIICLVLQFLSSLNEFPAALYSFDTASSYRAFTGRFIVVSALNALIYAAAIFALTAAAEPVYRRAFPGQLSISRMFSWHAVRTRSFFRGSLAGITLTFFFFAFEIGFYLLANQFGAWAPAEVPYSDLLNTKFPWVFVLLGGFFPAVSEEWMFRAFSIPFLQGFLQRCWPAILIASFIWGFGHANYPNQPFYIRGIEVGIVGLILSWAMFRFGILAPLIAHYSIDAFYAAFLLLRSGNPYLVSSGAVTAGINLLPVVIAAGAYLWTRKFREESAVANREEAEPIAVAAEPEWEDSTHPVPAYRNLSRTKTAVAIAVLVLGIVLISMRGPRVAGGVRFQISASQALHSARVFLAKSGFNLDGYNAAAQPENRMDRMQSQYIYSRKGIPGLDSVYGSQIVPLVWHTRFYKPLAREEYRVRIDPVDGKVAAFDHYLPEDDPGAQLSIGKAQKIAESFIKVNGFNLRQYRLADISSENRAHRRDTEFIWEALEKTPGAIDDARLRLEAAVYGDKTGSWNQSIKIPDEWKRARQSKGLFSTLILGVRTAFIFTMAVWGVVILVKGIRQGRVRWKIAGLVAAAVLLLEILNSINGIPGLRFQYDTKVDSAVYYATAAAQEALLLIGIGLAAAIAAALAMVCYPQSPAVFHRAGRSAWGRDAGVCAAATVGSYLALQWFVSRMHYSFFKAMEAPSIPIPTGAGTYLPLISSLRTVALSAVFFSALVVFAINVWSRLEGRFGRRALLLAAMIVSLMPTAAGNFAEIAAGTIPSLLLVAITCVMAALFLRGNYLAYPVCAAAVSIVQIILSSNSRGNAALMFQSGAVTALLIAVVIVLGLKPRTG